MFGFDVKFYCELYFVRNEELDVFVGLSAKDGQLYNIQHVGIVKIVSHY